MVFDVWENNTNMLSCLVHTAIIIWQKNFEQRKQPQKNQRCDSELFHLITLWIGLNIASLYTR